VSGRFKRKSRADKAPRHVRLYHYVLRSDAWKSLTANARAIYIEMAARYAGLDRTTVVFRIRLERRATRSSSAGPLPVGQLDNSWIGDSLLSQNEGRLAVRTATPPNGASQNFLVT
jgi:hypothetical protein